MIARFRRWIEWRYAVAQANRALRRARRARRRIFPGPWIDGAKAYRKGWSQ